MLKFALKKNKSNELGAASSSKRLARIFSLGLSLFSVSLPASAADWLAVDLNTTEMGVELKARQASVAQFFNDDVTQSVTVTQSIRALMRQPGSAQLTGHVDSLLLPAEIGAEDWISGMPRPRAATVKNQKVKIECRLNFAESRVSCDERGVVSIGTGTAAEAPTVIAYGKDLVEQIARESVTPEAREEKSTREIVQVSAGDSDTVTLKLRRDGLVTVDGGNIRFKDENQTKKILLEEKLSGVEMSVFVRDPATVLWDDMTGRLIAKKAGHTEVFVVTPGRISIIEATVESRSGGKDIALAQNTRANSGDTLGVPTSLASLDGLDQAATKGSLAASLGNLPSDAPDLTVDNDVAKLGQQALNGGSLFVRAKAKANFESVRIKIVDDRTVIGGANYPVGGVRVKVAGTEFSELTNALGEIEIRDVPSGARLLLDISDANGYLMPQMTEVVADRDRVSRGLAQTIIVRRFASLDLIARSSGVSQDMNKSSFCGVVADSKSQGAGVRVSLDAVAVGPLYINSYGHVDLRLGATTAGGRFCFLNVEPGPVAIGFHQGSGQESLATVIGLSQGRHGEESFDLSEARYVTTSLTTVATANEQLSSDTSRAFRHDMVEQADLYTVGSGQMMVPVDEGMMTTAAAVLPFKGRVWTVSASSDFETTVQAVPVKSAQTKQITTLIPNGFISDMSVFAQTNYDSSAGSVVVEHGNLQGHSSDGLKMRLVDVFGRDVGDGWYFADQPVSKAVFFNVPPGVYALVIETATGHWVAADTVVVYSESVSVAKTGAPLEKARPETQRASLD